MVGICRLCAALRKRDVLTTITDTNHVVCHKLRDFCKIQIRLDDALPKCICGECLEALQQAHSFYIKVHESQETLARLFAPVARVTDDKNLNTAKPLTTPESLAPAIHLTANETPMIRDENEVNHMLDKVEEVKVEIDDEDYLIEKILGHKFGEEDEEEFICDVRPTAINQSSDGNKAQNSAESSNNSIAEEQPSEPARSAATSEKYVDNESEHVKSGDEEAVQEELEEELENIENVYEEDILLQENQQFETVEELSMQLQPSMQADDTWNATPWLCCLCSAAETSFSDLLKHCQDTHGLQTWNDIQFKCADCQKICPRYYSFVNHVRFHHRASLTLCCDVCNLICTDFMHLAIHRHDKHANDKDFPLIDLCDDCGRGFKDYTSRRMHSRIHAQNGNNFICTDCGKSFALELAWKRHQKLHTENKLSGQFSCEQCGKSFRYKIKLLRHKVTHMDDRPYECYVCQKSFKTSAHLENHHKTHTDVKNFKCDFCDNTFRTQNAKRSHERTHTDERPYKCKYCERPFRFRSTLVPHEKTHASVRKRRRRTAKPNNASDVSTQFT